MIRATNKEHIITKVMEEYVSGAEQLSVVPGVLSFLKLKIHNAYTQREIYSVLITDPDDSSLFEPEFKLVTDKTEWRHWVSLNKSAAPKSYDLMSETGDIDLGPNEECEILLKFLTFRDVPLLPQDSNMYPPQAYIRPRKVNVIVMQSNRKPQ